MEVEICRGVRNNSPAQWNSPENGWRFSGLGKTAPSADLGGCSKQSNDNFED